ncbi:AAA family ATPase [Arthrobacter citreus]|uniref:ATP-binding protein n=1 Tax=Arthrobacter TaxID=1663 RepID=UPI00126520A4|nr:ATP-binding protein [Arthrobacter gandavensis]
MSKIIKLEANNFKRLRAVEISPDGNLVVIAGRNGQGKTSVLDAITAALGGNNAKTLPRPIRDGEDKASIVLETEDLIVTRTFSGTTSKLTVKGKDGATFSKGQAKLDQLLGRLSLDPLAFTQLSDKEQLATLIDLVDLPFDPTKLEAERAKVFAERTDVNRRVKELQGQAAQYTIPADVPAEEVSVSALLSQYREAQDAERGQRNDHDELRNAIQQVEAIDAQIQQLQAKRAEWIKDMEVAAYTIAAHPELPDLEAIQSQIDTAEQVNSNVRAAQGHRQIVERLTTLQGDAEFLTAQLAAIEKRKAEGLAAATFPVDGLGFDTDGVTYQSVPFKQASGAEQLRVSLAMAIALNPGLKVIRIADGSLLDSTNLQLIEEMAVANDYQVWIEMVDESGDFGITIEDGSVAA